MVAVKQAECIAGSLGQTLSVGTAIEMIRGSATALHEHEEVGIVSTLGRVTATPVVAPTDLPPFDNSAMDGFAVNGSGYAIQRAFQVEGRIPAGDRQIRTIAPGTAARIFTGAPIPIGCEAVVMQENCTQSGNSIIVDADLNPGGNIRRRGEYLRSGAQVLSPGKMVTARDVALLAAVGVSVLSVVRRVRVGVVTTGSELIEPGEPLGFGQIYNSNSMMVQAELLGSSWIECLDFGTVPDDKQQLRAKVEHALRSCDVLVTTGGVSAGEEDHVTQILAQAGVSLQGMKVAMRPGKPVKFGVAGSKLVFGLPGNPNAAFVTFRKFVMPALRRLAGLDQDVQPRVGSSAFQYRKKLGRTEYVPVLINRCDDICIPTLDLLGRGSSADVVAMARADGLAELPAEVEYIRQGDAITFDAF